MKFTCYTLGCKVNQYETQAMEQLLTALGHTLCPEGADCDAIIVNTCTVTAVADRKNRTLIRRLRREHPQAVLGVCGCYAQLNAEDIAALGVDVVSGSAGREEFLQRLLQRVERRGEGAEIQVDEALRRRSFEVLPAGGLAARTRAMLKVQDGCNNFCTYCIIPYARGPVRSEPRATAVAPAAALAAIREMARQTGPAQYDDDGMLLSGTLVRHLVLPGCVDNSLRAMELLAEIPDIQVSLLRQYAPPEGLTLPAPLDRRVTDDEYAGVLSWAELCGTPVAYTQGADSADGSFTPAFDGTGLDCFT